MGQASTHPHHYLETTEPNPEAHRTYTNLAILTNDNHQVSNNINLLLFL